MQEERLPVAEGHLASHPRKMQACMNTAPCCKSCRVTYGGAVEASDFRHNIADGIWMLMVGMGSTLVREACLLLPQRKAKEWHSCCFSKCGGQSEPSSGKEFWRLGATAVSTGFRGPTPVTLDALEAHAVDAPLQALDVVPLFRTAFHGPSLVLMLLYLWSKRNPTAPVSIFGLIRLQVPLAGRQQGAVGLAVGLCLGRRRSAWRALWALCLGRWLYLVCATATLVTPHSCQ